MRWLFGGWSAEPFRVPAESDALRPIRDRSPTSPHPDALDTSDGATDDDIFASLRQGDRGVLDAVYRAYYADLCRFAAGLMHSRDLAREVVQDVFTSFMVRPDRLPTSGTVRGYLLVATRHRALDALRRGRRTEGIEQSASLDVVPPGHGTLASGVDDQLVEDDRRARILAAVRKLPERQQRALWLRMHAGLGFSEIGRVLGVSADAARMLVNRGQVDLRRRLTAIFTRSFV